MSTFATAHLDPTRVAVTAPSTRRLNIALIETGLSGRAPHADVQRAIESTVQLCRSLGHRVTSTAWPVDGPAAIVDFENLWSHVAADCVDVGCFEGRVA